MSINDEDDDDDVDGNHMAVDNDAYEDDGENKEPAKSRSGSQASPSGTPIKNLPFSPSQFLNSPEANAGKLTSTPVGTKG